MSSRLRHLKKLMAEIGYISAPLAAEITGESLSFILRCLEFGRLKGMNHGTYLFVHVGSLMGMFRNEPAILERLNKYHVQDKTPTQINKEAYEAGRFEWKPPPPRKRRKDAVDYTDESKRRRKTLREMKELNRRRAMGDDGD